MNDTNDIDALAKIKEAAEAEFGKEDVIFINDIRVYEGNEDCWQLRRVHFPIDCGYGPVTYRLDVLRGDINSHAIFDLSQNSAEEVIGQKFKALNVSYEDYMEFRDG